MGERDKTGDIKHWSQLNNANLIFRSNIYDGDDDEDFASSGCLPSALSPTGLLFHVVVFITKSNILLCP